MSGPTCQGCGKPIPPSRHGRPRKWCGERCRRGQYAGTCERCGAPTNGHNGRGSAARVCLACLRQEGTEQRERIYAAWEAGVPTAEIARREGASTSSITGRINRGRQVDGRDLSLRRSRNREDWPEIERRWNAGESGEQIAAAIGKPVGSVYMFIQTMRGAGIDIPPRNDRRNGPHARRDEVLALRREGFTSGEIARALGMNPGTVSAFLWRESRKVAA